MAFNNFDLQIIEKMAKQLMDDKLFPFLRPRARKEFIETNYPDFKEYAGAIVNKYRFIIKTK